MSRVLDVLQASPSLTSKSGVALHALASLTQPTGNPRHGGRTARHCLQDETFRQCLAAVLASSSSVTCRGARVRVKTRIRKLVNASPAGIVPDQS